MGRHAGSGWALRTPDHDLWTAHSPKGQPLLRAIDAWNFRNPSNEKPSSRRLCRILRFGILDRLGAMTQAMPRRMLVVDF